MIRASIRLGSNDGGRHGAGLYPCTVLQFVAVPLGTIHQVTTVLVIDGEDRVRVEPVSVIRDPIVPDGDELTLFLQAKRGLEC